MTNEELIQSLGLSAPLPPPKSGGVSIKEVGHDSASSVPLSESAIKLDSWSKRRGQELLKDNERLAQSLKHDSITPEQQELAAADFAAAAYELDPELEEGCVDSTRHQFLKQLMETPQFKSLHSRSQLDMFGSELAATSFAEQYGKILVARAKERKPGDKSPKPPGDDDLSGPVAEALEEASDKLDKLDGVRQAMGLGGDGATAGTMDATKVAKLFQVTRRSDVLRRICELAGRYRRVARSRQRQKVLHGVDDVVGVTLTNKFSNLVATELARLSDDDLELDTVRRVIQRQAMGRERRGIEPVGKGPIVVIVDESGSMGGSKVENSKALALALAWVARQQKRWCALVGYSGGTDGNVLILPPNKWGEIEVCMWLEHFFSGGTDLDYPLHQLPTKYWPAFLAAGCPRSKTDIVVVTDAIINISAEKAETFNAWRKAEQVHQTALIVGGSKAGSFASICDVIHNVGSIECDSEEIGSILSL